MKPIYKIKKVQDTFYMYWTLTDFCNFKCHYCPGNLHSGDFAQGRKQGFPSNEEIQTFIDRLINQHLRGRELYMVISGGEPTLHPMFESIIEQLAPYGYIGVNTNGSRDFSWWSNLQVLPQQVTISLHSEYSKIEKINDLAHFLLDKDIDLQFNLSCDPGRWQATQDLYSQLANDLKPFVIPKVLNYLESTRDTYPYTQEQKSWIHQIQRQHYENRPKRAVEYRNVPEVYFLDGTRKLLTNIAELTITNQHNFRGWLCSAGDTSINAHFDGEVYSSICKIKKLGRLESFELLDSPVVCDKNFCTCPGDIVLDKQAPYNS